jgi:hypothetical protein
MDVLKFHSLGSVMKRSSRLDGLARHVGESRRRITELIEESALSINGYIAWGQFLDAPRKTSQYGLYGTSAAVQILAASGYSTANPLISKALAAIPGLASIKQDSLLYDNTDLALTFKEAAIIDACQPNEKEFVFTEPVEEMLLGQLIDGHGWGNYYDGNDQDDSPKILPTAHALLSLRRSREFCGSEKCEAILKWFCETASNIDAMKIHEACMALLVLAEYESPGIKLMTYRRAYQSTIDQLCQWLKQRKANSIGEIASYHYWVFNGGVQHNHYMYYPTDLLAALALIRAGNPKPSRQKVKKIIELLCRTISAEGGYRSRSSNRLATVDQMWAYRLLSAFNQAIADRPNDILSPIAYTLSANWMRRGLLTAGALALGAAGTAMSALDWLNLPLRVLGGILSAVALGVLASAFFVWLRGE